MRNLTERERERKIKRRGDNERSKEIRADREVGKGETPERDRKRKSERVGRKRKKEK